MELRPGLHHLGRSDLGDVVEAARVGGWTVMELDGREIVDRKSFFDNARETLPMDPPLLGSRSWDALADSVWGGLDALAAGRVLIIWPEANRMASSAGADYEIAIEILGDLARSLGSAEDTDGNSRELCVIIA